MFASFFLHFGTRKPWPSMSACLIIAWHHPPAYNLEEKTCHSQSDTHCTQNLLHQLFKDLLRASCLKFLQKKLFSCCVCVVFKMHLPLQLELETRWLPGMWLFPTSLKDTLSLPSIFLLHSVSPVAGTNPAHWRLQAQGLQLHLVWLELNLQTRTFLQTSCSMKLAFTSNFVSMVRKDGEDQLR